jgi:peptide/nickel transport system permease protein
MTETIRASSMIEQGSAATARRRSRRRYPWLAISVLAILGFLAIFGGFVAPHDMYEQNLIDRLDPPVWMDGGSLRYPLGTDALGRDILSRLIGGARTSLAVALTGLLIGGGFGGAMT